MELRGFRAEGPHFLTVSKGSVLNTPLTALSEG